jgi:hypothetical protein
MVERGEIDNPIVSDCCFTLKSAIFQLHVYHGENKLHFRFVFIRPTCLAVFLNSLNKQSTDRDVAPLGTHYLDSNPTMLCREATNTNFIVFGLTR